MLNFFSNSIIKNNLTMAFVVLRREPTCELFAVQFVLETFCSIEFHRFQATIIKEAENYIVHNVVGWSRPTTDNYW